LPDIVVVGGTGWWTSNPVTGLNVCPGTPGCLIAIDAEACEARARPRQRCVGYRTGRACEGAMGTIAIAEKKCTEGTEMTQTAELGTPALARGGR